MAHKLTKSLIGSLAFTGSLQQFRGKQSRAIAAAAALTAIEITGDGNLRSLSPNRISSATLRSVERSETEIEMVKRHIRVGEAILARQRKVIMKLSDRELPTEMAYGLLQNFEEIQAAHCAHLERLQISN